MSCRSPTDEDRECVIQNLKRLKRQRPGNAEQQREIKESDQVIKSEQKKEKEIKEKEEGKEEQEIFPWPLWTDPPYKEFKEQRRRLLQVIGMEHDDIFGDERKKVLFIYYLLQLFT